MFTADPWTSKLGVKSDLWGDVLTLPDIPSGRLIFYATLAWVRWSEVQKNDENKTVTVKNMLQWNTQRQKWKLWKLIIDGLCPPELVNYVMENDVLPSVQTLPQETIMNLIWKREIFSATQQALSRDESKKYDAETNLKNLFSQQNQEGGAKESDPSAETIARGLALSIMKTSYN